MGLKIKGQTNKDIIDAGENILITSGVDNARADAETLLCFLMGCDKLKLFLNYSSETDMQHRDRFFAMINRRASGEPLQYITGEQYFMGYRFSVNPSVLIIRPETELLAEKAIEHLKQNKNAERALDLCTGSGVLAVSISLAFPGIKFTASDISSYALATARANAEELGVSEQIQFISSDLFSGIRKDENNKYDLIVTNPPYVKTKDIAALQREIRDHEPKLALDGGADGLDFYRIIAAEAGSYMRQGACLFAEIGYDQAKSVSALFSKAGFKRIIVHKDLSGRDRIIEVS